MGVTESSVYAFVTIYLLDLDMGVFVSLNCFKFNVMWSVCRRSFVVPCL